MTRRFHDLDSRTAKYKLKMVACGVPEDELRELWEEQRAAQLSIRARKQVIHHAEWVETNIS